MADQVESIMRKIHLLFAKCEAYQGSSDKIILSKREMFDMLQELNTSIYELLDQYEATTRSKERAKLEVERQAAEILLDAKQNAQEVHAASLIYTDTMLDEIKKIALDMQDKLENDYLDFQVQLEERLSFVSENKEELKTQLTALNESNRYLKLLQEKKESLLEKKGTEKKSAMKKSENKKEEPRKIESAFDEIEELENFEEYDKPKKAEIIVKVNTQAFRSVANQNREESSASRESEYGTRNFSSGDFNLDAEYDQWKDEKEGKVTESPEKGKRSFFGKKK